MHSGNLGASEPIRIFLAVSHQTAAILIQAAAEAGTRTGESLQVHVVSSNTRSSFREKHEADVIFLISFQTQAFIE